MLTAIVVLSALASLGSVLAAPTNITVTDQSPTIKYFPSQIGDASRNWNVSYADNSWSNFTSGTIGTGASNHFTTFIGATASFTFKGTGVWIQGTGESNVAVTVGGTAISGGGGGLLAKKDGMTNQWWDVVVKVTGSGGVSLTGITFTVSIGNDGATLSTQDIPTLTEQNIPNADLSFSGQNQWGNRTVVGDITYKRIDTSVGNARVVLPPISGETFIVGYGSVNYDHGSYRIDSSGPTDGWPKTAESTGKSPWMGLNEIIFFASVDWGVISLTNLNDGQWLDLSSISYTTASGGTPGTGSNGTSTAGGGNSDGGGGPAVGVIVGAAIGGVAFAALVAFIIWFCMKKRKQKESAYNAPNHVDNTSYEIDPYTETTVASPHTGYFDNPEMAYANAAGTATAASQYGHKTEQSRHSYMNMPSPTVGGLAVGPYPPHSAMSEGSSDHPSSPIEGSSNHSAAGRNSKSVRTLPMEQPVRQEMDAGRFALVPPSYDPTWAQTEPVRTENTAEEGDAAGPVHSEAEDVKRQLREGVV